MKRFVKFSTMAAAVGMAVALAGCGGCAGCAGCSGETVVNVVTTSNWYTGTSYKGIQPSFIKDDENFADYSEKILYDVTFEKPASPNSSYSVEYKDGSYLTEFYATYYDWNGEKTYDANGYRSESYGKELVYCYTTELHISVRYTLASGKHSDWFEDEVITESYFRAANKNLQPVYSRQYYKTTSPNAMRANSLSEAYTEVNTEYKNYYNHGCTQITSICTDRDKENKPIKESKSTYEINKAEYTLFDNSSLYIAVRSMKLSPSYSQAISLFSAPAGGISSYGVAASAKTIGEKELKEISAELAKNGLYKPTGEDDKGISTIAMDISYIGGSLAGTAQTVWYAAIENPDNNTARTTMLKISTPLSYNLGTLNYTLKEIKSTLWSESK